MRNIISKAKRSILILGENTNDTVRGMMGFIFGLMIMYFVVRIFVVISYDFENMRQGTNALISGINPWEAETRIHDFYNPPFSVLFLWPLLITTPQVILMLGGAFLFAIIFYQKAWVGFAFFATNTFLYLIGAGGIDMYVMGAGLFLLMMNEKSYDKNYGVLLRVLGYGFLMVKPQGGIFIVIIYILLKRDWKGLLISAAIYGLFFINLYSDWLRIILTDAPQSQTVSTHTLWGKFGPFVSIPIAIWVIFARKWKYWQLGGALAGILAPYGMPGIPIFLTLTAINRIAAIPIIIVYSGCLAVLTWKNPPAGHEFFSYVYPFMAIYHLSMLGLALILACHNTDDSDESVIDFRKALRSKIRTFTKRE